MDWGGFKDLVGFVLGLAGNQQLQEGLVPILQFSLCYLSINQVVSVIRDRSCPSKLSLQLFLCSQLGRDAISNLSTPKAPQFELWEGLFADHYRDCDKVVSLRSLDSIS